MLMYISKQCSTVEYFFIYKSHTHVYIQKSANQRKKKKMIHMYAHSMLIHILDYEQQTTRPNKSIHPSFMHIYIIPIHISIHVCANAELTQKEGTKQWSAANHNMIHAYTHISINLAK